MEVIKMELTNAYETSTVPQEAAYQTLSEQVDSAIKAGSFNEFAASHLQLYTARVDLQREKSALWSAVQGHTARLFYDAVQEQDYANQVTFTPLGIYGLPPGEAVRLNQSIADTVSPYAAAFDTLRELLPIKVARRTPSQIARMEKPSAYKACNTR
jgi:hypothetical protein